MKNIMVNEDKISRLIVSQATTQQSIESLDKKNDATITQIAAMNSTLTQMLEVQIRHEERNKFTSDKVEKLQDNIATVNNKISNLESKTDKTQSITDNLVKLMWLVITGVIAVSIKTFLFITPNS